MTDTPMTATPTDRSFRHTVTREPGSRVVLEVEADADRLTRQADRVFERHNQKARISGFRPGKAPRAMYERQYGTEHLWAEAAEDVIDVNVDGLQLPPFARNAHVEAGRKSAIEGLGDAFVGIKAGSEKKVDLKFPDDTTDETVRGKTGTFSIRPSQVSEKVVPALDD